MKTGHFEYYNVVSLENILQLPQGSLFLLVLVVCFFLTFLNQFLKVCISVLCAH